MEGLQAEVAGNYTQSTLAASDWTTFFGAVALAVQTEVTRLKWAADQIPIFTEDFPKVREGQFDTRFDVILWSVHHSMPAQTDNKGVRRPNGIWKQVQKKSPDKYGYLQVDTAWQEEMVAEFTILAKTNSRGNELVRWFHRLMMNYAFALDFFRARGINYFAFLERTADAKTQDFGQELYTRTLRYKVRLELLDTWETKTLEAVNLTVSSHDGGEIQSSTRTYDGL